MSWKHAAAKVLLAQKKILITRLHLLPELGLRTQGKKRQIDDPTGEVIKPLVKVPGGALGMLVVTMAHLVTAGKLACEGR